jgi:hypothetical protein
MTYIQECPFTGKQLIAFIDDHSKLLFMLNTLQMLQLEIQLLHLTMQ